ncbi:MAG: glycosyltransferase [Terriglobia bacterium]
MAEAILAEQIEETVEGLGPLELVVGIPSYNNVATIGRVIKTAQAGLASYFGNRKALIVNSDGDSNDGTSEAVEKIHTDSDMLLRVRYPLEPVHRLTTPYHGLPGKGSALRTLFQTAKAGQARALVVVDPDVTSVTPEWFKSLLEPILSLDFDFVAPYYQRHKYDGTMTNSIVYPLTRALYGRRIRQPIGGEFGISGRLASHFLKDQVWNSDVARYGIDIWMTTTAVASNFKVCQTHLGAKIHETEDQELDLSAVLVQVVGSVFNLMETHDVAWRNVLGSLPVPLLGSPLGGEPEPASINVQHTLASFQQGVRDLLPVYERVFSPKEISGLQSCAAAPPDQFSLEDELWVSLIYDLALAYHRRVMDREHLLKSLAPLYLGWVASFARQTESGSDALAEHRIERLCLVYEQFKPYLISQWPQASREKR